MKNLIECTDFIPFIKNDRPCLNTFENYLAQWIIYRFINYSVSVQDFDYLVIIKTLVDNLLSC